MICQRIGVVTAVKYPDSAENDVTVGRVVAMEDIFTNIHAMLKVRNNG